MPTMCNYSWNMYTNHVLFIAAKTYNSMTNFTVKLNSNYN